MPVRLWPSARPVPQDAPEGRGAGLAASGARAIPVLFLQALVRRGSGSWALGSWFVHAVLYVDVGWAAGGLCPGVSGACGPGG